MLLLGWMNAQRRAPAAAGWPVMSEVLGHERARRWSERAKYGLRLRSSNDACSIFSEALHGMSAWRAMFQREPALHYVPFRLFLDRRWSTRDRFGGCLRDMGCALAKFGPGLSGRIAQGGSLRLCEHAGFGVDLMRNAISCHEGLWALRLSTPDGQPLFNLSFGFLDARTVLVASVQGLQKCGAEGQDPIRAFTKAAHGLRPHAYLLACCQAACRAWGVEQLYGIDPVHQVKRRRDAGKQGFHFDYREFWQSLGGEREGECNWRLPRVPVRRPDDEIPSQKRAAYRRRYALLDGLDAQVAGGLARAGAVAAG